MKKFFATLCVLTLALAGAASAFAEATPYGSVRMKTMYVDSDNGTDTTDLEFALQSNTRLGVSFKVSDEVSGKIEMGLGLDRDTSSAANDGIGPYLRLAYGVWDFGAGTLTIGQDYAAFDWGSPSIAMEDNDMAGFGALSINRSPQVTARFDQGVYVSLIKNPNNNADADDVEFPILAAGYDGKIGSTAFGVGAGYATFDNGTDDVDTYFVYAQAEQALGNMSLLAKIYYGQNLGNITVAADSFAAGEDTTTIAGFVALVGSFNDKVSYVTGVGYQINDNDSYATENDQLIAYVDVPVQITKGFQVVPTITYVDGLDESNGTDGTDSLYVGAKWQFDL